MLNWPTTSVIIKDYERFILNIFNTFMDIWKCKWTCWQCRPHRATEYAHICLTAHLTYSISQPLWPWRLLNDCKQVYSQRLSKKGKSPTLSEWVRMRERKWSCFLLGESKGWGRLPHQLLACTKWWLGHVLYSHTDMNDLTNRQSDLQDKNVTKLFRLSTSN